eukprot:TRINITY_DN4629_c1_g1_i2.p1 TRINITY_DN4629_c1_g1~~TRINITY_DN4629_c1_g1_i2.p1  ORF type:complete len:106 (-),score=2.25 TRINITY_DN4629_c1_g1_i2:125-442(-)
MGGGGGGGIFFLLNSSLVGVYLSMKGGGGEKKRSRERVDSLFECVPKAAGVHFWVHNRVHLRHPPIRKGHKGLTVNPVISTLSLVSEVRPVVLLLLPHCKATHAK